MDCPTGRGRRTISASTFVSNFLGSVQSAKIEKNAFLYRKMCVEFVETVETAEVAGHDTITRSRKILLPLAA